VAGRRTAPRQRMSLFLLKCFTQLGRVWLKSHGVRLGRGGWVHGFPELRLKRGSVLEIGNHAILGCMSRFNPLAPARRLSFVTNTPTARITLKDGAGVSNSVLSCFERIVIGENSLVGAECLIIDSDFHDLPLGEGGTTRSAPVEIEDHVFIGTRSIILKGVRIGRKSVIGAGSVVSRDVPPFSLAAGNPARVIRSLAPSAR
jgi:acetyltransferase-like isoleucine patch superfamily enzyme